MFAIGASAIPCQFAVMTRAGLFRFACKVRTGSSKHAHITGTSKSLHIAEDDGTNHSVGKSLIASANARAARS